MLTKTIGSSLGWAFGAFGAAFVLVAGCGGTGDTGGSTGTCTPNQQVECPCPGGTKGVQVCNAEGNGFDTCQCGTGGSGGGGAGGSTAGAGGGSTGLCGNGHPDPGECDQGEFQCPQDCMGTGGAGGGTTTSSNTCDGIVTFAGFVEAVPSVWGSLPGANGKSGYEAGIELCAALGADHPCTYEEVRKAEMAGELSTVAAGTTAWVHRTTPEMVNGNVSLPGAGGRCNDWTYGTNHLSDGEFVHFDTVGVAAYSLDNDTVFSGVAADGHADPALNPCGNITRSMMCCYPACVP